MYGHDIDQQSRTKDVQVEENVSFSTMLLPDFIVQGLHSAGFKRPSPIQLASIPLARCGLDLIVQAKSGTGKTLVFGLTALESVDMEIKRTQVIIIAPTREIAVQIADVIETVGKPCKGLKVGVLIGGMKMETSKAHLREYQVVVGAPGRIRHLIEKDIFDSKSVRLMILDEADKLMEDVFVKDVNYIFHNVAESKQMIACSATYTPELVKFVKKYMKRGAHVTPSGGPCPILLGLKQFIYPSADHCNTYTRQLKKQEALFRIISTVRFDQCLIFSNYVVRAETLCGILQKQGWSVECLTSKQTQENRLKAISNLKEHKARILVSTDLAARGIDASAVNLVINMEVPMSPEVYLHRIGRAGRFGNAGLSITIVSKGEDQRNFQVLISKIRGGVMAINVIPMDKTVDLWQEEKFNVLEPVEENEELGCPGEEKEVSADHDGKDGDPAASAASDGKDGDPAASAASDGKDGDPAVEGELENADTAENAESDLHDSASSGIDVSSPGEVKAEDSPRRDRRNEFHPKRRDWKNRYGTDDGKVDYVDSVVDNFSNLQLEPPHRYSSSPWRHGHENLWRNGRPQSCFPFQFPYGPNQFSGFQDSHYPESPGNFYNEPTFRYDQPRRNYSGSHSSWHRNSYWMSSMSSQIDNYVQYSRRFHS